MQKYVVFFNDRSIQIINNISEIKSCTLNPKVVDYQNKNELFLDFKHFISNGKYSDLIVIASKDFEKAKKSFDSFFTIIYAAGGIVTNLKNEILCINRLGKWDFPKGKVEKNETSELAAIREVEEETGLKDLQIIKSLETTNHIYSLDDVLILKHTYWFEMCAQNVHIKLKPQTEENIEKAVWIPKSLLDLFYFDSYKSIKLLLSNFDDKHQ